jgi:hypothetical protein
VFLRPRNGEAHHLQLHLLLSLYHLTSLFSLVPSSLRHLHVRARSHEKSRCSSPPPKKSARCE